MELGLRVDTTSGEALHRQVYDAIRAAILSGRLSSGDRLPPSRTLSDQLSLSRTTVAEAYEQLRAEGYVEGRHGSGTFVAPTLPKDGLRGAAAIESDRRGSRRTVPFSDWGKRVMGDGFRAVLQSPISQPFVHDLRPHRIAQDQFPWEAWKAAVDRALGRERVSLLSYPPAAGHAGLREAISAHVARYRGVICSPEQVVVVNGSQQGLNLLSQLLLDPGDRVAVEDPGYPAARLSLEARAMDITRVPVDGEGMKVDGLLDLAPQRLVHVTPSHQDPTGATLSLTRRLALLDVAQRTGCLVVEDDYDSEFRYEGHPVESLQGLDRTGLVVYAGTFSKSVLAGLRIGFLVLPSDLVGPFIAAKSLWDSGAPLLEQAALAEFMRAGDYERHIRKMRRLYRSRRDQLVASLTEAFGDRVDIGPRHGGLNLLVSFDVSGSDEEVALRAADAGVGLRPASPYFLHPPKRPSFLLGFAALPEADIREGIRRLAGALGIPPHDAHERQTEQATRR